MHFFPQIDPFPLSNQQWALKRYADTFGLNFEMDAQSSSVAAIDKFKKTALVLGEQGKIVKYTYLTGRWIKDNVSKWAIWFLGIWLVSHWSRDGYYIGTDSGCSCYTPFEHYTKDARTGPLTREQMEEEVMSLVDTLSFITPEMAKRFLKEEVA